MTRFDFVRLYRRVGYCDIEEMVLRYWSHRIAIRVSKYKISALN